MNSQENVKSTEDDCGTNTLSLESYAQTLQIELAAFDVFGLRTVNTATGEAVEIPYRLRDGTEIARRIRRNLTNNLDAEWVFSARVPVKLNGAPEAGASDRLYLTIPRCEKDQVKELGARWDRLAKRWYVPSGMDSSPFERWLRSTVAPCLYGLENIPDRGHPLFLVVGEPACHVLWQHGFDAVALSEAGGYTAERDDPELDDYDVIALLGMDEAATTIERLSLSCLRHTFRIADLEVVAAAEAGADVAALVKGAVETARTLEERLAERPLLDRLKHPEYARSL